MAEASEAILTTRGLTRTFGGLKALYHVSITVPRGAVVGIIGPNGSGKSTVLNLISGHLRPSAGDVWVDGHRTTKWAPQRVHRLAGVGRTFQQVRLFRTFTVAENVIYGLREGRSERPWDCVRLWHLRRQQRALRDEAQVILDQVSLGGKADDPAAALSYGQSKMLEVARALASDPQLLLLDEPAAGLSPSAQEAMGGLISHAAGLGKTVMLVEHNFPFVRRLAQHVIVLDAGAVIYEGTPDGARECEPVQQAYFGRRWHAAASPA